jgi:hypothetical protein
MQPFPGVPFYVCNEAFSHSQVPTIISSLALLAAARGFVCRQLCL